jgi:hypothetical protein
MITNASLGLWFKLVVVLAAVLAIATGTAIARPLLPSCLDSHGPNGSPLSVRSHHNMSCTQAKGAIAEGKFRGYNFTTPGFRCSTHVLSGAAGGYRYACTAKDRSFKFVLGT